MKFKIANTKIEIVIADLGVSRPTAMKYLEELIAIKLVTKHKLGKDNYYVNHELYKAASQCKHLILYM